MAEAEGNEYRRVRVEKLDRLREAGLNPYPERFERSHDLAQARALDDETPDVAIAGRVMTMRVMGKLSFLTLQDHAGRCQVSIRQDEVGADPYKALKKLVDIGDFLGVRGKTYTTKTGEKTVAASDFVFLGKTLRGLPEKWHGISDRETLYRQRYLDLLSNRESMERFLLRSHLIQVMRRFLEDGGFLEVETPILAPKASGAAARPFKSHHNALDMSVYLRIAPETYLKRCIVGGFDKVFEFARCFRNEGMDPSHLQDFTMLEYYCAWWNYEDNMDFTQRLVQHTLQTLFGTLELDIHGHQIDFGGAWLRVTFRELLQRDCGLDIEEHRTAPDLRAAIAKKGIVLEDAEKLGRGNLIDQLYKKVSRPKLVAPTFITQHPIDLSPLARRNDDNPEVADRFQLVVDGWEVVNAYSELVDPIDQRQRLESQAGLKAGGDEEAMDMDEDYLLAMEHGMPPISGWGMGIDRFCALITNQDNLRDVVLFPLMRPAEGDSAES
ncbi:MAG: lysine--tRNA ligase [Planctomycetes bacterium]|nr:lysine--tRNA ligase [Planctomycetota bacterium]